jgi:hypothetical protein
MMQIEPLFAHSLLRICLLAVFSVIAVSVFGQTQSITGSIVSGDGTFPWQLTLVLTSSNSPVAIRQTAEVADDGSFRFDDVAPGLYSIQLSQSSGYVWSQETKELLRLQRWQPGDHANLSIVKGGVITGVVVTASGEPAVGLKVRVLPTKFQSGQELNGRTDDRGRYRIYGIEAGTYVVAAYQDRAGASPSFHPYGTRDTAAEIELIAGLENSSADIRLHDQQGWSISGQILNSKATSSTQVQLLKTDGGSYLTQVSTNPSGYFLLSGITEGSYLILAEDQTSITQPHQISLRGNDVSGLKLTLSPLAEVSGQITIAAPPSACAAFSAKAQGQQLSLQHHNPPVWSRSTEAAAITNKAGAFQFQPLLPGPYRLGFGAEYLYAREIKNGQKALSAFEMTLGAGATIQLKILLDYGGKVSVKAPFAAQIWFFNSQGRVVTMGQTDQKGRFKSDALAVGEYRLITTPRALTTSEAVSLFQRQRDQTQPVVIKPCQASEFISK